MKTEKKLYKIYYKYYEEISKEVGYTVKPSTTINEWIELDGKNTDLSEWC